MPVGQGTVNDALFGFPIVFTWIQGVCNMEKTTTRYPYSRLFSKIAKKSLPATRLLPVRTIFCQFLPILCKIPNKTCRFWQQ